MKGVKDNMYFDYVTENKSFVDMANYLKRRGIKNYNFMLTLHDYDLYGVDPYDPDISFEIRSKVIKESVSNIWYYLREVVRLPAQGGGHRQYQLNLSNMAQVFLFLLNTPSWVTIPRDCSLETDTLALLSWPQLSDSTMRVGGISLDNTMFYTKRIKDIINLLPEYLRDDYYNIQVTPLNFRDSNKTNAIASTLTQDIIWITNAEYISNIDCVYDASYNARQYVYRTCGNRNCMLFTSVISDDNNGQNKILGGAMKWEEEYFDGVPIVHWESSLPLFHIQYSYEQLGKDRAWFKQQSKLLCNSEDAIRRELLLKRKSDPDKSL